MNYWLERVKAKKQLMEDLADSLASLMTRTTRYMAEDGRERAVLLWDDYVILTNWLSSCSLTHGSSTKTGRGRAAPSSKPGRCGCGRR